MLSGQTEGGVPRPTSIRVLVPNIFVDCEGIRDTRLPPEMKSNGKNSPFIATLVQGVGASSCLLLSAGVESSLEHARDTDG